MSDWITSFSTTGVGIMIVGLEQVDFPPDIQDQFEKSINFGGRWFSFISVQ